MASQFEKETAAQVDVECEQSFYSGNVEIANIEDGDEALKILHTLYEPFTKDEEKRLLRKIDLRLALLMLVVNGLQFVDKLTISQAATYGLIEEAHLKGQEFSLLISLFYIGYLVAQYPTNFLMQKYPIGKYITINFICWGIVLTGMSGCTNFGSLAITRFLLGVFESCLSPGFVLITSSWWKTEEQPARVTIWYCAKRVASVPAGFIFYAVAHINARGIFAYQWMFLFFGIFTVLFGISLWWLLPDSPATAIWLSERERLIAVERLKSNKTGIKNTLHKKEQVQEALLDPKVWLLVAAVFIHNMTNSLQSYFTGIIIKGFGYSTYQALLLQIPGPAILAVVMLLVMFFLSSKWGQEMRIFAIILCYVPGVVSCAILLGIPLEASKKGVHLFAIFIIPICTVSAGVLYSLLASNVAGYTKKTVAGALFFGSYCVSNILSPQAFIEKQAPKYTTGIIVSLTCFCLNMVVMIILYSVYARTNAARDADAASIASSDDTRDLLDASSDPSDLTDLKNKMIRYTK